MNAQTGRTELWPTTGERVARLLARYPDLSKDENREILEFMKTGRHLEIGLLTSNDKIRPNLGVFMKDHRKHFRVSFGETTAVVVLIAGFLLICWLLWELIGAGAA